MNRRVAELWLFGVIGGFVATATRWALVAVERDSENGRFYGDAWSERWYSHAGMWALIVTLLVGGALLLARLLQLPSTSAWVALLVGAAASGILPADYRVPPAPRSSAAHAVVLVLPMAAMGLVLLLNRHRRPA